MLNGKLTISRSGMSSNPEHSVIHIELMDDSSGLLILRLDITPEEYGMLLSGNCSRDCKIVTQPTQYTIDNMGKEFEGKTIYVESFKSNTYSRSYSEAYEGLHKLISKELVFGWEINNDGLRSQQNDPRGHRVQLKRYVEKRSGEIK